MVSRCAPHGFQCLPCKSIQTCMEVKVLVPSWRFYFHGNFFTSMEEPFIFFHGSKIPFEGIRPLIGLVRFRAACYTVYNIPLEVGPSFGNRDGAALSETMYQMGSGGEFVEAKKFSSLPRKSSMKVEFASVEVKNTSIEEVDWKYQKFLEVS